MSYPMSYVLPGSIDQNILNYHIMHLLNKIGAESAFVVLGGARPSSGEWACSTTEVVTLKI